MADKNTSNDWLDLGRDFFDETLESITAELPGSEQKPDEEDPGTGEDSARSDASDASSDSPEEAHIETPDEILARMRAHARAEDKQRKAKKTNPLLKHLPFFGKKDKKNEELEEEEEDGEKDSGPGPAMSKFHPRLRHFFQGLITFFLIALMIIILLFRLNAVENETLSGAFTNVTETISDTVTPVQGVFGSISDSLVGFLRRIKYWYNLEQAYEELREENEQLVYKAMLAEELQKQLSDFKNLQDEITANQALSPVVCTVIGKTGDSYFSTLTISKGRLDGISEYMAVTLSGALIGYTETVTDHQATVRTIIDSEASIAALIQSSRDQGTIRGTLGVDGTPMCRMYYLPDDHLPRPGDLVVTSGVSMSFPKGIPIGTVRESTRGMEANKQYVVVEPQADFQHIEYVIVLCYQPEPGAIQADSRSTAIELVPLETARPYPTIRIGSLNYFTTDAPEDAVISVESSEATPTPPPSPSPTPAPTAAPVTINMGGTEEDTLEYVVVTPEDPNVTPTPTPSPTPTPYITLGPDDLTLEED